MSETDSCLLPTSMIELAVTIINGSPIYAKSLVLARRISDFSSIIVNIIVYTTLPHYCYPVKSPALAIILFSLLCLLTSKPGKICTHNSIDSFLITSSSVVCSEFNRSLFTIMVRVKRLISNYFEFF